MTQHPITTDIFYKANRQFSASRGTYRWGQALWNTAEDYVTANCSTEVIEKFQNLRSTDADCYYSDYRTQRFCIALDCIFEEDEVWQKN